MPKKRLTTNGNVFRRTDGRWQSVIWYFDEHGEKKRKVFSSKTKNEAQQKITNYIAQFNEEVRSSNESQKSLQESRPIGCRFSNSHLWSGQHMTVWNAPQTTKSIR